MAGVFARIRVQGLAHIHRLLDKDVDWNSVQVVAQNVRDLEKSVDELGEGAAESAGYVRTVSREKGNLERRVKELDGEIELILFKDGDESNNHLATARQVELDGVNVRLTDVSRDLEEARSTSQQMDQVLSALKSKHVVAVQQLQKLRAAETSQKAKENAVKSLKMVADMAEAGENVSVDNVLDRMRRRQDVTDEKFDRAMSRLNSSTGGDVAITEATAKIEERKRKMAQSKVS